MRKIKFRQRVGGKFFYWGFINGEFRGPVFSNGENYANTPHDQDTGLKDKNGKEIYEGDIVSNNGSTSQMNETEIVKLENGGFFPFAIAGWECTISNEKCEIIGNIYDNRELMTKYASHKNDAPQTTEKKGD